VTHGIEVQLVRFTHAQRCVQLGQGHVHFAVEQRVVEGFVSIDALQQRVAVI
jgi:hypothetical protein